jgi:hypothetical protein
MAIGGHQIDAAILAPLDGQRLARSVTCRASSLPLVGPSWKWAMVTVWRWPP